MNTFLQIFIFIVSFPIILKAADLLISGASSFAKRINVSNITIGLTIVAFGTSAPEFGVTFLAAMKGMGDIAIGNVVGSNIFNLGFILGGTALLGTLKTTKPLVYRDGLFLLFGIVVLSADGVTVSFTLVSGW